MKTHMKRITTLPRSPCPFCGALANADRCIPAHGHQTMTQGVQIECMNCGARGPIYGDEQSAFLGWTYRDPVRCD